MDENFFFDLSRDPHFIIDEKGDLQTKNSAFTDKFPEEKTILEVFEQNKKDLLKKMKSSKSNHSVEFSINHPNENQIHFSLTGIHKSKKFWGVARDVSCLVERYEQKINTLSQESIGMAKSAQGEMAASVVHEIGGPLSIINYQLEKLRVKSEELAKRPEELHALIDNIQQTTNSINRVIDTTRRAIVGYDQLTLKSTSLFEIIKDCQDYFDVMMNRENAKIFWPTVDQDIRILCNKGDIIQVVINLLKNSNEALKNLGQKWIRVEIKLEGEIVQIHITDSGPGVPQKIKDSLMEPFVSTKKGENNKGLGLSISSKICNLNQGRLFLDENSTYTKFIIELSKA